MERYSIYLDRKDQHWKNNYTTKCNLEIQCDPYQITYGIFHRTRTKISEFIGKHKRPQIANAVLRKKNGAGNKEWSWRNQPSWLQTILQSYSHQDSMVLAQNRNIDQRNKIESPEINPCTYRYLIFDKGGKNIQWGNGSLFNKWCWENWTATCKRLKLEYFLTPYTKINSKWFKDLNVRPETIKLLEENISRTLDDIKQDPLWPNLLE